MLKITLNGETREMATGCTVSDVLAANGYAGRKVAVEINREIVPKSQHEGHALRDGDRVEIVHALGGG